MESLRMYMAHPDSLDRESLYKLRMIVAKYPFFDAARLLMLKNLYLLHDIDFGKEMRKAALYLKNRKVLFELMEGYGISVKIDNKSDDISVDRTMSLIDAFLENLPRNSLSLEAEGAAAVDYVSTYLTAKENDAAPDVPKMRGQSLIDNFLSGENEKITLQLKNDNEQHAADVVEEELSETTFFTETLANIYIKQRKYSKALEIIRRLCLEYPNKNRYFADQIRFLEKIVKHQRLKEGQ